MARSDADESEEQEREDEERAKKPVPAWARRQVLREQLKAQQHMDPDEIFRQKCNTCSLDEVFVHQGEPLWISSFPRGPAEATGHIQTA